MATPGRLHLGIRTKVANRLLYQRDVNKTHYPTQGAASPIAPMASSNANVT